MPAGRPQLDYGTLVAEASTYVDSGYKELHGDAIPTVEGLAKLLGISRETIYAREEFSDIIKRLKAEQARTLLNGSLLGKLNPLITKLILSSKHDYVEKTAASTENLNQNLNQDVTDVSTEDLEARVQALRAQQTT